MATGEQIRDSMIKHGTEMVKEAAYAAGNSSETFIEKFNFVVKVGTVLESSRAGGTTIFKASRDYMRGDPLCLGLCLVSTACEGVAIVSSTCKFVPYRKTVWLSSKAVSQSLMRYRNLCAGEGC
jgi:hypothetical protein